MTGHQDPTNEPKVAAPVDSTIDSHTSLSTGAHLQMVVDPLVEYTSQLTSSPPSAPILLPDRDALTVRLVSVWQLQRLDELRNDSSLLQGILFTLLGALLGFIASIYTSNLHMNRNLWTILMMLSGVTILIGLLAIRASRRATEIRGKLFNENSKITK